MTSLNDLHQHGPDPTPMKIFSQIKHLCGILITIFVAFPAVLVFEALTTLGIAGVAWSERLADRVLAWGRPTR